MHHDLSFEAFVERRSTALLRMAFLLTGDRGHAEDLLQVALLRTARHWSRAREAPEAYTPMTEPDGVREAISQGVVELLGQEQVDGITTLRLRIAVTQRGYQVDVWVDSSSYLPVQEAETTDGRTAVTTTLAWLARAEEKLARLVLTPPPRFRANVRCQSVNRNRGSGAPSSRTTARAAATTRGQSWMTPYSQAPG